jgi:pimeloyl-ACP methyl ester carboxylesterase
MKTRTVTGGGGVKLHVHDAGNPNGKAILFVHGFSQCGLVWSKQLRSDLADTFRLVAMDLRGHGLSEKPRDAYGDSQLWADDVHSVIEELQLDAPVVAGWSYGGAILSDYIGAYGEGEISATHWIGAVCRLGEPLVAPGFLGEEFIAAVPGLFSENVTESVTALQRLLELCMPSGLSAEERYLLLGCNMVVPPYVRKGLLSRNLDNDAVIERLEKPMLISWGERDTIVSPRMGDHIAQLAKASTLSFYPGGGHAPFWEAPDRFNRELREFRESV